jgi:hypothetical protein
VIELQTGKHLARDELRALLAVLESAWRVTQPYARAQHIIGRLRRFIRESDGNASNHLGGRANGYDAADYSRYDLVDSGQAARLLGITAAGVRDLITGASFPATAPPADASCRRRRSSSGPNARRHVRGESWT